MQKLLKCYEDYKSGHNTKISQYKIDLQLNEVNCFRNKELNELKDLLPATAFNYIKVIDNDLKKNTGISLMESPESGFKYNKKEIERKFRIIRK